MWSTPGERLARDTRELGLYHFHGAASTAESAATAVALDSTLTAMTA
jgi:hypothetical protein